MLEVGVRKSLLVIFEIFLLLCILSKLRSANGCVNALGSATIDLQGVGDSEGLDRNH